ncbi:MAG: TonB-dependent receptor, partial [Chitinophagaceae bacterium]
MSIAKTLLFVLLPFFACDFAIAQNTGSLKGQLKDSSGKQVLSLATVTVFVARDTSIITYRLSDPSGNYKIPGLPLNIDCRVLVSFSGYKTYRKDFTLSRDASALDLGVIKLHADANDLEEVTVYAERPPVSVRKDTIEFNASAFKTLPSALLEDLLKKLPGLEIDPNGDIMVKGKKVSRLLVDGKEFFGGDPQIATKNLPANIVDKVQVMNDKEQMERNPETPESDISQVINIKLKKSIKQGWFGKAYAGAGTNNRHEVGAFLNAFRDTTQVSILGYTNNINKTGFGINDVLKIGGFNRSGFNSINISSDGGFAINDISFGGTGQGLQRSSGAGINFNDQYGKKLTLNLQYFFGQVNSDFSSRINQQRFFKDTTLTTLSLSDPSTVNTTHRIGGTITWKADPLTTITFRPGVTVVNNRNYASGTTMTSDNFRGRINQSRITNNGKGNNTSYNTNIFLNRSFKKKGRTFSANLDFSNAENNNDNYSDGIYTTFSGGLPDDSLLNQLRRSIGENLRASANLSYAEPLDKNIILRITQNIAYIKENNGIDFQSRNDITGKYDIYNQDFSNSIYREGWRNTTSASLNITVKKFVFRPGVNYLNARFDNVFTKNAS